MQTVKLFTRNGDFVHDGEIPPFNPAPEAIAWGSRVFFRASSSTNHYYEGMIYPLFDLTAIKAQTYDARSEEVSQPNGNTKPNEAPGRTSARK